MDDLPNNVILNKVTTGSGMTTLALTNPVKYVITVPYVNIILSKLANNVLSVYAEADSGITYDDILNYQGDKIICTYDSLPKVTAALAERGDLKSWKLLIDECQKLVDAGSFRAKAIKGVLTSYPTYGSYVFGTATPIKDEFQLPELRSIPKITVAWEGLTPVNVRHTFYPNKLMEVVATIARNYLENNSTDNAHIFLNSVTDIIKVIRYLKAGFPTLHDNLRIVCADNEYNVAKIPAMLGTKYSLAPINSLVKKLNFYTATAFEGCDIFDTNGKTFIISNGSRDHAKIDILTTLPQIIGRIRNSIYKNEVELIYSASSYTSHVTQEEFSACVKDNLAKAAQSVADYYNVSPDTQKLIREGASTNNYLLVDGTSIEVNSTAWYSEMNAFHTLRELYYVNKSNTVFGTTNASLLVNGKVFNYAKQEVIEIKGLNKAKLGKVPKYSDLCKEYIALLELPTSAEVQRQLHSIEVLEPSIKQAYKELGKEKMKALGFTKKYFVKETNTQVRFQSQGSQIGTMLQLQTGKFYPAKELKETLQAAYDKVGLVKPAKATDISTWYVTKKQSIRVVGIKTAGITIIAPKSSLTFTL